jgi:hypothetical protein
MAPHVVSAFSKMLAMGGDEDGSRGGEEGEKPHGGARERSVGVKSQMHCQK